MSFSDYVWFWKTSWGYMKGQRWQFWYGLIPATIQYRKDILKAIDETPIDEQD